MDKNNNSTEGLLGGFETILDDMIHRDDHDISPVVLDDNSDDLTDEEIEELKNKKIHITTHLTFSSISLNKRKM